MRLLTGGVVVFDIPESNVMRFCHFKVTGLAIQRHTVQSNATEEIFRCPTQINIRPHSISVSSDELISAYLDCRIGVLLFGLSV